MNLEATGFYSVRTGRDFLKHRLPPLDSLKAFEAAARHLSFTRAADELCISKGAVSYQIRKLETAVGAPLFKRSVRQVLLTDAGQLLFHNTQQVFSSITETLNRLGTRAPNVSVAATTYVAARWLSPRIAAFTASYPEVPVVFNHEVNSSRFVLEDVDLAIRWDRCDGGADGEILAELPMALFPACSPALAHDLGRAPSPAAIAGSVLLCEDRSQDLWAEWATASEILANCPRRVIADANVRVQAAIDGQGFILADQLMSAELQSGALIAPFSEQLTGYGYVLLRAVSRPLNREARLLGDALISLGQPQKKGVRPPFS